MLFSFQAFLNTICGGKVHIFSCSVYLKCHIQYFDIFWLPFFLCDALAYSWLSWVSHGISSSVSSSLSPSHIPVVPTMKRYKSLKLHQVDREDGHPWKLSSSLPIDNIELPSFSSWKKAKRSHRTAAPNILENWREASPKSIFGLLYVHLVQNRKENKLLTRYTFKKYFPRVWLSYPWQPTTKSPLH